MKRLTVICLSLVLGVSLLGCAVKSSNPTTYRVLNDAHAFLQSIRDSATAGNLTLTPTQKTTFNALVVSSNAADATWKAYHSGQSTDAAALAAQVNKLNADLSAAQAQIVLGKP